jgi:hypothetical protein
MYLMDSNSGDVWVYTPLALKGGEKPIHLGKLILGQSVIPASH